jgi:hypothetical protein
LIASYTLVLPAFAASQTSGMSYANFPRMPLLHH